MNTDRREIKTALDIMLSRNLVKIILKVSCQDIWKLDKNQKSPTYPYGGNIWFKGSIPVGRLSSAIASSNPCCPWAICVTQDGQEKQQLEN